MAENGKIMIDRRNFLFKSASFLAGSLFGLSNVSKALAFQKHENKPFFQPRVALIIDDIGYSFSSSRQFLDLKVPITFSVLPRLTNSYEVAREIHARGHEIMLHQPMEPYNPKLDPGPGAIYVGSSPGEIMAAVQENITTIPFATGANNHMGSRVTERPKEMNEALSVIKKRGLFFVDSRTSIHSIAYKVAHKLHIVSAYRNTFLDNSLDESDIIFQLHKLTKHAQKYGRAIGIGHPFPETAKGIREFLTVFRKSGVSLVHISQVLYS